jgi:hypothetical protein
MHSLSETGHALESVLKSLKKRADRKSPILEKRLNAAIKKKSMSACGYLREKPNGYHAAITEVTQQVNAYIKRKCLQIPQNLLYFAPDEKLTQLLGISDQLSFFSQGYTNRHFSKGRVCSQEVEAQ